MNSELIDKANELTESIIKVAEQRKELLADLLKDFQAWEASIQQAIKDLSK